MSKMREVNSDDGHESSPVVLHRMPPHQSLMRVNRLLMYVVVSLMAIIVFIGFLLIPSQALLSNYKKVDLESAYQETINPVLSAEINALKGQLIGLVSGSIESKLRILEQSVKLGTVSYSLGTIEDLKNDVKMLRSYSDASSKDKARLTNEQLVAEVSQLKELIYLTIGSCSLMLAAIAGVWFKNRYRLPYKKSIKGFLGK